MTEFERIIQAMTPEESAKAQWSDLTEDSRISLEFISRTIDVYPWDMYSVITTKANVIEFVIKHVDKIKAIGLKQYSILLIYTDLSLLDRLPAILQLSWREISQNPDLMQMVSANRTMTLEFLEDHTGFSVEMWENISRWFRDPAALVQRHPDKISMAGIVANENTTEDLIRANQALLDSRCSILLKNMSLGFIEEFISRYPTHGLHLHPEVKSLTQHVGCMMYTNPVIRNLDFVGYKPNDEDTRMFSLNPNVTPEFVLLNLDMSWNQFSIIKVFPIDIILTTDLDRSDAIFNIKILAEHAEFSYELFIKHRSKVSIGQGVF